MLLLGLLFDSGFDVIAGLMYLIFNLDLLFDSGFDVVVGFISWFKNIEEQVLMFLDLNSCNFLFLIFLFN